jgi:hypothetical protein
MIINKNNMSIIITEIVRTHNIMIRWNGLKKKKYFTKYLEKLIKKIHYFFINQKMKV